MVIPLSTLIVAGISLSPLISLIAGILILIMPRLLNFIVAIYLIIIGLFGLFNLSEHAITTAAGFVFPESAVTPCFRGFWCKLERLGFRR
jgi:hypothetical protein